MINKALKKYLLRTAEELSVGVSNLENMIKALISNVEDIEGAANEDLDSFERSELKRLKEKYPNE